MESKLRPRPGSAPSVLALLLALGCGTALAAQSGAAAGSETPGKPRTAAYLGKGEARASLAPAGTDLGYLRGEISRLAPDVCVESLAETVIPPALARLSQAERELAIGNALRSIASLEGIEYFSASRGKRRVLFEEAFAIASPESREPAADPLRRSLPAREEAYAFMRDSTFGGNAMRLEYRYGAGTHSLAVSNVTPMRIGPLTAVGPGRLEIVLSAREDSGRVLVYALALARASAAPGMRGKIRESTENRVYALMEWISSGLSSPPSAPR